MNFYLSRFYHYYHYNIRQARETWLQALKASYCPVEQKRRRFWQTQADNSTNPSRLWQTIDSVLGRGKENNPTSLTSEGFSEFSASKVEDVRRRTQCVPPPQYREVNVNVVNFSAFNPVTVAEIMKLIKKAANKQSWLDPIPTWLLQECSDVLSPLCNTSLHTYIFYFNFF